MFDGEEEEEEEEEEDEDFSDDGDGDEADGLLSQLNESVLQAVGEEGEQEDTGEGQQRSQQLADGSGDAQSAGMD
eukprot:7384869-Prymnesium_polylepis.1